MGGPYRNKRYVHVGDFRFNLDFFESNIKEENGCHLWQASLHDQGYAFMSVKVKSKNKNVMTVGHRVAMMMHLGRELTRDEYIIHSCDNPACVNPAHLILGDAVSRNAMMVSKGRSTHPAGEPKKQANRKYKFTDEQILFCRQNDSRAIAQRFDCTRSEASKLRAHMINNYKWLK